MMWVRAEYKLSKSTKCFKETDAKGIKEGQGFSPTQGLGTLEGVAQMPSPLIIRVQAIHFLGNFLKTKVMKPVLKDLKEKEAPPSIRNWASTAPE